MEKRRTFAKKIEHVQKKRNIAKNGTCWHEGVKGSPPSLFGELGFTFLFGSIIGCIYLSFYVQNKKHKKLFVKKTLIKI